MSAGTIALDLNEAPEPKPGRVRWRAYAIALAVHLITLVSLAEWQRSHVMHVGTAGPSHDRIGAFVLPAPATTLPASTPTPQPKIEQPRRAPDTTTPVSVSAAPPESAASTGAAGAQTDAPVRLGPGDRLVLLKKVEPVYPPLMQTAGMQGTVVLDAAIHRDGTIGDITVLKSWAPAFERAAIDAVKQWRYTPLPYEGIVTVTLNFTLHT